MSPRLQIRVSQDVADLLDGVVDRRLYVEAVLRDRRREVADAWSAVVARHGSPEAVRMISVVLDRPDVTPQVCREVCPDRWRELHTVARDVRQGGAR
jgi:hypothetical protein